MPSPKRINDPAVARVNICRLWGCKPADDGEKVDEESSALATSLRGDYTDYAADDRVHKRDSFDTLTPTNLAKTALPMTGDGQHQAKACNQSWPVELASGALRKRR